MFNAPPFLVTYTAPGHPQVWEPPRSKMDSFFKFANPKLTGEIAHWPDFCTKAEAEEMGRYVIRAGSTVQIIDILHTSNLPPGVGHYPVEVSQDGENPGEVSVWMILSESSKGTWQGYAGALADLQAGLLDPIQSQYLNACGANWDNSGKLVGGKTCWPWNILYASKTGIVYWANSASGPML